MSLEWKLQRAEEEADRFLDRVSRIDATLVSQRPRPVEHLLSAVFDVSVDRYPKLTGAVVAAHLQQHGLSEEEAAADSKDVRQLAGFTYACGDLVVVLLSSAFGPDAEQFTLAHEAGHLVLEHLPRLDARNQMTLFDMARGPSTFATRDPPRNLFSGATAGERPEFQMDHTQWLREVKANCFAAELLAPWREVRRVASSGTDESRVDALQATFGLSRRAAEIRLSELGLIRSQSQGLLFVD